MEVIIGVKKPFEASHFLPKYEGKCNRMHGHTWHVTVEVWARGLNEQDMVMDLSVLKKIVDSKLDIFDHNTINDKIELDPTCENISWLLAEWIDSELPEGVFIKSVEVQEGDGGWARWEK